MLGIFTFTGELIKPFERAAVAAEASATAEEAQAPTAATAEAEPADRADLGITQKLADRFGIQSEKPDGSMTWQFALLSVLGLPIFTLLKALANYLNHYYMRWVGGRVVRDLRNAVFENLQNQSLKFYSKCSIGNLISRCTNDMASVEGAISQTVADLTRAPVEVVVAVSYVIYMALRNRFFGVLIVILIAFPLIVVPIVVMGRRIKRYTHSALSRVSDLVSRMQENFTGIRVVKAFHTELWELSRFAQMNKRYFHSVMRAVKAELAIAPVMECIGIIFIVAGLVFCYAREIRLYEIAPLAVAAFYAYRPIKQLAKVNANLQRSIAAAERIFSLLDADTALPEAANPVVVEDFREKIVFDHVSFRYDENDPLILSDISFELAKGHVIAFVGQTGSGKTTIANLLARFYDPTSGRILLDGTDLRDIQIESLRRQIGVVTQETILFNETIADNIAYGSWEASREEIIAAAEKANAHEFIMANPEGYDRVVGEKGFVLSGGQRQRIAIARAILRNPPILILDEATSALDTVTERLVQEALSRLMENRTVFAIAHRLSTIKHADQILVIDGGKILERGTHNELYAANGTYRELCDMQFS
jgi:subfamily B ATP-binding cassette protein MsbA